MKRSIAALLLLGPCAVTVAAQSEDAPVGGWRPALPDDVASVAEPELIEGPRDSQDVVRPGQTVRIVLAGERQVEGRVLAIEPDRLHVKITQTSDPDAYSRGPAYIPRAHIVQLRVIERAGETRAAKKQVDWDKAGEVALGIAQVVLLLACMAAQASGGH